MLLSQPPPSFNNSGALWTRQAGTQLSEWWPHSFIISSLWGWRTQLTTRVPAGLAAEWVSLRQRASSQSLQLSNQQVTIRGHHGCGGGVKLLTRACPFHRACGDGRVLSDAHPAIYRNLPFPPCLRGWQSPLTPTPHLMTHQEKAWFQQSINKSSLSR